MPISRQLVRPAQRRLIYATLIVALLVNLLPWPNDLVNIAPDFLALMLLYWNINQPDRIRVGWAFIMGLLMDTVDGNVMGQHALAYSVASGLLLLRQRQFAIFPFWQQAFLALGLLLIGQVLMVLVRLLIGDGFVGGTYFVGSFISAFLWVPLSNLMMWHQRRAIPDEL